MTDDAPKTHNDKLHEFAADLLLNHCTHFEYLTVVETADDKEVFPDGLSDEEAELVHDLILSATVRVSWPSHEFVYGNTFEDEPNGDEGSPDK